MDGHSPGDESLTLTRCLSCELSEALEGRNPSVAKPTTKEHKGGNFFVY